MIRTAKSAFMAVALSTTALSSVALAATPPKPKAAVAVHKASAIKAPPIVYQQRILPNGMKVFTSRDATTRTFRCRSGTASVPRTIHEGVRASPTCSNI